MKTTCITVIFVILIGLCLPAYADQAAEEIFKAIIKIRSIVPKDAHTAPTLGTEREGSGVVIDS